MSRWINAEWLNECFPDAGEGDWTYNRTAQGYIDSAPSIDIVRCGECKYYDDEDYGEPTRYCTLHESAVEADDFCSYGEREGE